MSVALERNNSGGLGNHDMGFNSSIYNPNEFDRRSTEDDRSGDSSSSSSIGQNSDVDDNDDDDVESEFKSPLDSLDALEEVLPIKKSISIFYSGKSKSFTRLSDAASCASIEEIKKPDNAYTRKRKNLLAFNNFWEKNRGNIPRGGIHGISKRPSNSQSMLSLLAAANCAESESNSISSSSPGSCLPPLPPHARIVVQNERPSSPSVEKFPSWRAFSMSDLQSAAAGATVTPSNNALLMCSSNE